MRDQIGLVAGKVWHTLETKGELTLPQLPKILKESEPMVYQAVGWLAREGKITYRTERNHTFVSAVK